MMERVPDAHSERRLEELRSEALRSGSVDATGVRARGGPLPPEKGTYYGVPLLKPPVWSWEVPVYFFVGGLGGASAVIAFAADLAGADRRLVRNARWVAFLGSAVSVPLLIFDLGRPKRFLNMLRVFKRQSPMSVGAWTVSLFGVSSAAAALGPRFLRRPAEMVSALSGVVMATYTGVLIGATAIPVWARYSRQLPAHFAASAMGSAASLLELCGADHDAVNSIAIAAAGTETVIGFSIEVDESRTAKPLNDGRSGALIRAGGILSGPVPAILRLFGGRTGRRLAAVSAIAGSLMTRFAWIEAGKESAKDPKVALEPEPLVR